MRYALLLLPSACAAAPPAPWAPGDLIYEQIGLSSGTIGESALIVGPDGTSVLLDVGNDRHADEVTDAVLRHLGVARVDWIVLTHFHADHIGAVDELALEVTEAVITRGPYDLDPADANVGEVEELAEHRKTRTFLDLCTGEVGAPDDIRAEGGPWPASSCPGLDTDEATIPLGEGAALRVLVANGFALGGRSMDIEIDENARSLGGTLRWGPFVAWWGGDLSGGGKDTPDVEGWLAEPLPDEVLPDVNLAHLSHHGISSSTSERWVERIFGSGDHNALVGATGAYLDAPSEEALEAVSGHLGGGRVWVTETGALAGDDAQMVVAHGSVLTRVQDGGAIYSVEAGDTTLTFETSADGG